MTDLPNRKIDADALSRRLEQLFEDAETNNNEAAREALRLAISAPDTELRAANTVPNWPLVAGLRDITAYVRMLNKRYPDSDVKVSVDFGGGKWVDSGVAALNVAATIEAQELTVQLSKLFMDRPYEGHVVVNALEIFTGESRDEKDAVFSSVYYSEDASDPSIDDEVLNAFDGLQRIARMF